MPLGRRIREVLDNLLGMDENTLEDDIRREYANLFSALLGCIARSMRTKSGRADIVLIDPDLSLEFCIIEVKRGTSSSIQELEKKQGSRRNENALEELKRYLIDKGLSVGMLADLSRIVPYERVDGKINRLTDLEVVLRDPEKMVKIDEKLKELKDWLEGQRGRIIRLKAEDYIERIANLMNNLIDPLSKIYYQLSNEYGLVREYEKLKNMLPTSLEVEDFLAKTSAAIVTKLFLIKIMDGKNLLLTSDSLSIFKKEHDIGYLLLFEALEGRSFMKFPNVFKSDIEYFEWWSPIKYPSSVRVKISSYAEKLNYKLGRIFNFLEHHEIPSGLDLLGMAYQEIRKKYETSVLGAYFTPHGTADLLVDALNVFASKIGMSSEELFVDPDIKIIDPTCGSGTFLLSFTRQALQKINEGELMIDKGDLMRRLLDHKLYGIDIDPLAALMARVQLLSLAKSVITGQSDESLDIESFINVITSNTLDLLAEINTDARSNEAKDGLEPYLSPPEFEIKEEKEVIKKILKEGGFSVVIGNPPWGMRQKIFRELRSAGFEEDQAKKYLNRLVPEEWREYFSKGNHNLLTPFVIAFSKMLKKGGILAILVDARFMSSQWGIPLIRFLRKEFRIIRVIDISSTPHRFKAVSYPSILLGVKK